MVLRPGSAAGLEDSDSPGTEGAVSGDLLPSVPAQLTAPRNLRTRQCRDISVHPCWRIRGRLCCPSLLLNNYNLTGNNTTINNNNNKQTDRKLCRQETGNNRNSVINVTQQQQSGSATVNNLLSVLSHQQPLTEVRDQTFVHDDDDDDGDDVFNKTFLH